MNRLTKILFLLSLYSLLPTYVSGQTQIVHPNENLQQLLNNSQDGDMFVLMPGRYVGNFVINKQIQLTGKPSQTQPVIIDAQGQGSAISLHNSNITLEQLHITNWGDDLTLQNAGITSNQTAENIVIRHNHFDGDGFGIWLHKVNTAKVHHNYIKGNIKLRSADRGNGIQLSSVKNSYIHNNEITQVRDGIYVIASQDNIIDSNVMHKLRYGIHYMYSYDNSVINNLVYHTRAGYALMSSRRLTITGNITRDSEDYGFLLNYITYSTFKNNRIENVWTKPENKVLGRDGKGLFVYNSGFNTLADNLINTAEIGIHLTAGSDEVKIYGNSFINNPTQVKYVSSKAQQWSLDNKGNYWSNYLGWDMNNDNIGDVFFEPNDGIDKLLWQYPEMKMLMDSPAVLVLRWIQKQFPLLKPTGVKDNYPLMSSPHLAYLNGEHSNQELKHSTKNIAEGVTTGLLRSSE